jgi:nitroreductase
MANQVFETVRTLMAVREYDGRPIPDDVLRRIVEAGHLTASASNIQPWHFVLVKKPEHLRKIGSLVRTGPYIANAAAAVIVAYEKNAGKWGLSDGSRAVQDMMAVAWAEGVGSNWAGGPDGLDAVRQEFGFPDTYVAMAVVPLGYPKRRIIGRKKRKPFDQVVSAERFGAPLK